MLSTLPDSSTRPAAEALPGRRRMFEKKLSEIALDARGREIAVTIPVAQANRAVEGAAQSTAEVINVSKTACKSNAERLMTLSTSAVAICCCKASPRSRFFACTSSNRRTLPIAITA